MKKFSLVYLLEPLQDHETYFTKRMFGGLAVYYKGKMVLVITETTPSKEYRGKTFNFDLWNGLMVPTEKEYHPKLTKQFKGLITHPVLQKWLYLPLISDSFESTSEKLVEHINSDHQMLGIWPKT